MNIKIHLAKKLLNKKPKIQKAVDKLFNRDPYFSGCKYEFLESEFDGSWIETKSENDYEDCKILDTVNEFMEC